VCLNLVKNEQKKNRLFVGHFCVLFKCVDVFIFLSIALIELCISICGGAGNNGSVVKMIRRRTSDVKVGVRKAGLQVLEAVVLLDTSSTRISVSAAGIVGVAVYNRC